MASTGKAPTVINTDPYFAPLGTTRLFRFAKMNRAQDAGDNRPILLPQAHIVLPELKSRQ